MTLLAPLLLSLLVGCGGGGGGDGDEDGAFLIEPFGFGTPGRAPVTGDWDGDGVTTVGVVSSTGLWTLRNTNTAGAVDVDFRFTGGTHVAAGDWTGAGASLAGSYDSGAGSWSLAADAPDGGAATQLTQFNFPSAAANPQIVCGDWDGNGSETTGFFDPDTQTWSLRDSNSAGTADYEFILQEAGTLGVVGDWNGDGITTVGLFDPDTGTWILAADNPTSGFATVFATVDFDRPGQTPIAGDWNGDGVTDLGFYDPSNGFWTLRVSAD